MTARAALFPDRPRRPILADVTEAFPFPLASTYARLYAALHRRQEGPTVWMLHFQAMVRHRSGQAGLSSRSARGRRIPTGERTRQKYLHWEALARL
jgi:hypothetical protein